MKAVKRLLIGEVICLVLVITCFFEFSLMSFSTDYEKHEAQEGNLERTLIKATVSLEGKILKIHQEIRLTEPRKEMYLNIPANIYASSTIFNIAPSYKSIVMKNDNVAMLLSFFGETKDVIFDYEVYLKDEKLILSHQGDEVYLSQFLITPAPIIQDRPILSIRSEFGDPFVYDMQDYEITITADKDYKIFAPGMVYEYIQDEYVIASFVAKEVRDFPVMLFNNPRFIKKTYRDIEITYVNMPEIHNTVIEAFDFIEKKTGYNYPYKEFFIIGSEMGLSGMEMSRLILISESLSRNSFELKKIINHEIFHQWFYGVVGTNQVDEPYIDEGMVCYLTNESLGEKTNVGIERNKFCSSLDDFRTKREYYKQVYNGGCAFYAELGDNLGCEFDTLLHRLLTKYSGKILTHADLLAEISILEKSD